VWIHANSREKVWIWQHCIYDKFLLIILKRRNFINSSSLKHFLLVNITTRSFLFIKLQRLRFKITGKTVILRVDVPSCDCICCGIDHAILDNLHFWFKTYDRLNDFQRSKHVELDSLCKTDLESVVVALYQWEEIILSFVTDFWSPYKIREKVCYYFNIFIHHKIT
jgi:hypothetical protein